MPVVPTPRTWGDQDVATAPVMNTEIRDILNFALAPPRAVLARKAALSLTSGTRTAVTWDTEVLDTAGGWTSGSPRRYTTQYPGKYKVSLVAAIQGSTGGGGRFAYVALNQETTSTWTIASAAPINSTAAATMITTSLTLPYTFAIGEFFTILVEQTSGAALNLSPSTPAADSYLTIEWMGN